MFSHRTLQQLERELNHINSGNEGKVKDKERKYEPKWERIFLENGNPANSTARV